MGELEQTYGLAGVETKEDLLQALEREFDNIMDDHGIYDDDSDVEYALAALVIEFLERRGRTTTCDVCGQAFVTRLNLNGCPYTERSEHEEHEEDDDDD